MSLFPLALAAGALPPVAINLSYLLLGIALPRLYEAITNAFAWNFTLLLCLQVLLTAESWRRTRWRLDFTLRR